MVLITAAVRHPTAAPRSTITRASCWASSRVFMNAPRPTFTSRTSRSRPSDSFLLMMLGAM